MERKSYTQQEINMILQELADGRTIEETTKAHDVSRATIYRWKKRAEQSGAQEISRLKKVDEENQRLKSLLAEAALEIQALKEQLKQRG
ncbi:transposase [uncultured Sneathiella sp.]|jgi:putative transposase|uniref:transposase n=1 Tax=uncultured Sneathiella sp. TaxID=879315 RepID=UPI0030D6FDE9|tara:strand:+ start:63 stop:329 length:267 start_codon:yes stop_codon:yes gene_type:complete